MSGYCTCGAKLPEDARFCHKCGKPQRDEDQTVMVEEALAAPLPIAVLVPQIPPIGFRNRPAVGAALVSAVFAFLLWVLSGWLVPGAFVVVLVAAGFLAVYLYQRRTGQRLSMVHGAHLGWLSGIFGFGITTVVLSGVVVALSDPAVVDAMREQLKGAAASRQAQVDQMLQVIHNPSLMFMGMAVTFLLFTVLPAFGGALGAKFLHRHD